MIEWFLVKRRPFSERDLHPTEVFYAGYHNGKIKIHHFNAARTKFIEKMMKEPYEETLIGWNRSGAPIPSWRSPRVMPGTIEHFRCMAMFFMNGYDVHYGWAEE